MAWSTPLTAVANAALTAAQWNASVRDNLNETAPAKATAAGQLFVSTGVNAIAARTPTGARVSTAETTASTTFAALATAGPIVTVTTGTQALVFMTAQMTNNTANGSCAMGFDVSGATTIAASNAEAMRHRAGGSVDDIRATAISLTALTAGSNTFTAKYIVNLGTGTFSERTLVVVPL